MIKNAWGQEAHPIDLYLSWKRDDVRRTQMIETYDEIVQALMEHRHHETAHASVASLNDLLDDIRQLSIENAQ